jgi:hypothetical protein
MRFLVAKKKAVAGVLWRWEWRFVASHPALHLRRRAARCARLAIPRTEGRAGDRRLLHHATWASFTQMAEGPHPYDVIVDALDRLNSSADIEVALLSTCLS